MALKLGVNRGISNTDYHADRNYLSSSVLKTILKSPSDYEKYYLNGENKPAPTNQNALDEGNLAHSMILEPETVSQSYSFYPGAMKRGADFEAFVAHALPGKPVISSVQRDRIERLVMAYSRLPEATGLLVGAEVELSVCADLHGVPVKVRFDAAQLEKGIISDVKTTGYSGQLDSFKQTVSDLEYDLSAALYTMVAELHFGRKFDFYFIVLSKKDFTCEVYKTSEQTLIKGRRKVLSALDKYKACKASGLWLDSHSQVPKTTGDYEIKEV